MPSVKKDPRTDRPHVISDGMDWTVISRNERDTTFGGHHFFACRCRPGVPWQINEHDQRMSATGTAKMLNRFEGRRWPKTATLSAAVRVLVEITAC